MYKIYKLISPDTNKIFYIGLTKQTLKQRLRRHISESKTLRECNVEKMKIIRALMFLNLNPIIETIEECETVQEANEREIFNIAYYRQQGHILTNISEGGDYKLKSVESIEKMRKSLVEFYKTDKGLEHAVKITHFAGFDFLTLNL